MAAVTYRETLQKFQFKNQISSKINCKVEREIQACLKANDSREPALW
jgi:hypothetical protein